MNIFFSICGSKACTCRPKLRNTHCSILEGESPTQALQDTDSIASKSLRERKKSEIFTISRDQ